MGEPLRIRTATEADLPALIELYRHLIAADTPCPEDRAPVIFEQFLRYPGSAILLGECGQDLAASCTLVVIPNLTRGGRPYALIENVVTRADFRNRGFGKLILRAATERAWQAGCYKVMLMTGSKRASTLAFYEAAGFEQSKTGFQIRRTAPRED